MKEFYMQVDIRYSALVQIPECDCAIWLEPESEDSLELKTEVKHKAIEAVIASLSKDQIVVLDGIGDKTARIIAKVDTLQIDGIKSVVKEIGS